MRPGWALETAYDTGVQGSDDKVRQKIQQDKKNGCHQHGAGNDGEISGEDRVIYKLANAGAGKDDLGENRR